jgi:hypothetical protein
MTRQDMFTDAKNCFQQRINEIVTDNPTKNLIEDLLKLTMFKAAEKDEKMLVLVELYNLLGTDKFMQVVDLCSDKVVKFPNKEFFKESIQTALCYYYKNYLELSWDEIKDKLEDQELPSIKMGIKIHQLEKFMSYISEIVTKRKGTT